MNMAPALPDLRHAPLPVCPPLIQGESFTSWVARIAARNRLPLALVLARLTVAASDRHRGMPTNYGLSLTEDQMNAVAAMTGTDAATVAASLIDTYDGGPVDLSAYRANPTEGIILVGRSEWVHLTRSAYCPDCLRETGGAWQLLWRLPWSFACPKHHTLLATICPGCEQPAGRGRGDRTLRPGFIADIPDPVRCRNSLNAFEAGYDARPGRAARPCGYDLADTITTDLGDLDIVTSTQTVLRDLVAAGGHRDAWKDLRALTSTLMFFTDTGTLTDLAPNITRSLFTRTAFVDAVATVEQDRAARAHVQERVRAGGGDHRTGTRQRYGTATPANPALMAVLASIALDIYGPPTAPDEARADRLKPLTQLARSQGKKLGQMLNAAGASADLLADADTAARATGRFHYAAAGNTNGDTVDPSAVPAYLWEAEAAPFLAALPDTREDTVRMFASMTIVKRLTGDSWDDVVTRLGLLRNKAKLTASLVHRLTLAGTQKDFLNAAEKVITRLTNGDIPLIDYADRRHELRHLKAVPAEVLHAADPTLVATTARRRNSAAWLWTHLTGGHHWEAPAWGKHGPNTSQKEIYRRFIRKDLPRLRPALLQHGDSMLSAHPADSRERLPSRIAGR